MKLSVQLHYHPNSATHKDALQICQYLSNTHQLINIYLAGEAVALIADKDKLSDWISIADTANIDLAACSSSCNRFGITAEHLASAQIESAGQLQLLKLIGKADQSLIFNS